MGIAACQARFLGITARKADCEYKSTELAQQKLEITNQLSDVASEYSNALNSTKLLWSNEAVGADYGLTYSLLMMPSAINDYNPYMITTTSGAVVLNSEYAAAAKAAGISKAGGVGSQDSRDRFIAALVPGGLITQETANQLTVKDYQYETDAPGSVKLSATQPTEVTSSVAWNPGAGMGDQPMDKASVDAMQLSDLILSESIGQQKIDWAQLTVDKNGGKITQAEFDKKKADYDDLINEARKAGNDAEVTRLTQEKSDYIAANSGNIDSFVLSNQFQTSDSEIKSSGYTVVENGIINHYEDEIENMTIGDLLAKNVVLMMKGDKASEISDSVEKLLESIAKVFGLGQKGVGLNVDDASNEALKYALEMTTNIFLKPGNAITVGSRDSASAMTDNSAYLNATEYNRISQAKGYTAVSLSNMISTFLTYFDNRLNGGDSDYVVGKTVETSLFVTDNKGYYYIGQTDANAPKLNEKLADFYDEIYNNICEHGWREDASLDDDEYLESMIKDGRYSLSSLNNDGYYYQTRYNETGYMVEVSDTDAISRAEAEYTQKKAELTYKEDSIDMKTKKLDAEISTLSTEYDTVKSLLSKNIEKTFAMFSG